MKIATILFFLVMGSSFKARATVQQVAAGYEFFCVLLESNEVKCWGKAELGGLGNGTTVNAEGRGFFKVDLGTNEKIVQLAGSGVGAHTCVLFESGRVKCWGHNSSGQLGLGDSMNRGDKPNQMGEKLPFLDLGTNVKVTQLAVGDSHTCAVMDIEGIKKAKCWGNGNSGQLANMSTLPIGKKPDQMGDKLPFLDFGKTDKLLRLVASYLNTCALFEGGKVKCWGANGEGKLGQGSEANYGSAAGQSLESLPYIDLGNVPVSSIEMGGNFACAILQNGKVKCWGSSVNGQLGIGIRGERGIAPNQMGDKLPTIDFGTNEKVTQLFLAFSHACAKFESNRLKCWGSGSAGSLGSGDGLDRGASLDEMRTLPFVDLGRGTAVISGASAFFSNCFILHPVKELKCFGYNSKKQLGTDNTINIGDKENQMGDALPFVDLY